MIIAIDGPAAAGKGSLAARLAKQLGYTYLDTGVLYRGVAFLMLQDEANMDDEETAYQYALKLTPQKVAELQDHPGIRSPEAGRASSKVSAYPKVRQALFDFQRNFPHAEGVIGAILDGRDIGTVIFPDANHKFYITASPEVRARRRFKEFQDRGVDMTYEQVLEDIRKRDEENTTRAIAPMRPAEDAIIIDTSDMTIEQVFDEAMKYVLGN